MSRPLLFLIVLSLTTPLVADQAMVVSRAQADAAVTQLAPGTEIRHHCAPCGDTGFTQVTVDSVTKVPWSTDENLVEIVVDGESIDLAYVYVHQADGWHNLAMLVGVPVSDVPERLPTAMTGNVPEIPDKESQIPDKESQIPTEEIEEQAGLDETTTQATTRPLLRAGHWVGKAGEIAITLDTGESRRNDQIEATGRWGPDTVYLERTDGQAPVELEVWIDAEPARRLGNLAGNVAGASFLGTFTEPNGTSVPLSLERKVEYIEVVCDGSGMTGRWLYPRLPPSIPGATDWNVDQAGDAARRHEAFISELLDEGGGPPAEAAAAEGYAWERDESTVVAHLGDGVLSIERQVWAYTGGAHGNLYLETEVYRRGDTAPERLALADLFGEGWQKPLLDRIHDELKRREATLLPERSEFTVDLLDSFLVRPDGLVILFAPYVVGTWAEGPYTVIVPWTELTAWLAADGPAAPWS